MSFAIPATATLVEGGSVQICVEMNSTTSAAAILGKDVIVTLSTVDGTGMKKHIVVCRC